jgi:nitrite reductase/ring-hydroxylating ferredoxin subunit
MNRNHFLKSGGMLLACACGSPLLNGCKAITGNSDTPLLIENRYEVSGRFIILDLSEIPELNQEGSAVKLNLPSHDLKMIIAKTGKETFVALRDQCTHGGREMEYIPGESVFRCVSFGHSKYDAAEGNVLKGPAKSKLEKFAASLTGERLEIKIV